MKLHIFLLLLLKGNITVGSSNHFKSTFALLHLFALFFESLTVRCKNLLAVVILCSNLTT
jgi:hypothetical protein